MDVATWLDRLGLSAYVDTFAENDLLDEATLVLVDADDLKEIGVASLGHRKRLLAAIDELRASRDLMGARSQARAAAMAGERRQVTVLFADLAGYTQLTRELGDEGVHSLMARFFDVVDGAIERFGGTVDKHIGDCTMAVFGAPKSHDNDPERAVRAAIAIREAMPDLGAELGRELVIHVGIASGQVVASGIGSGGRREYTVTGDSVNLASRLTDRASDGEILISDAVYEAAGGLLEASSVGGLEIKGFAKPVSAWRVLGLRAKASPPRRGPFVGRQAELRELDGLLRACRDGRRGQTVLVRGEAGIGKTRLIEELGRRAADAGFACHHALVLDFGAGAGHDAIASLVRSLLGSVAQADRDRVAAVVRDAIGSGVMPSEQEVYLNDLLGVAQPAELQALYDAMDSDSRLRGKRETIANLVKERSRREPLFIAIEDVHWADALTSGYLAWLAETIAAARVMLVMTSRPEGEHLQAGWWSRLERGTLMMLDLGPLEPRDAEALASTMRPDGSELTRHCIERAAGNPLFLEQLLQHADARTAGDVPSSVRSLVQARLDRIDSVDRQALQAASVFGQRFVLEALRHLLNAPSYECDRLVAKSLLRHHGDGYLFAHALIRDAVYDTLLTAQRRELHASAAAWFRERDPSLHAEHLDLAEHPDAPRALLEAARHEAASYHDERALRLVERGREIAKLESDRIDLVCLHGELLHAVGAMPRAREVWEAALELAPDEASECRARIGLAEVKRVTEELTSAFGDLDRAKEIAERLDLARQRARIHFLRANLLFPLGDIDGCLGEHRKSFELAKRAGSPELEAEALGGIGDAEYMRGRMISAFARFERCVELCREHGLGRVEVANFSMFGSSRLFFRPQHEALRDARAAAEAAARVGHLRAQTIALTVISRALCNLGEGEAAFEQAAATREVVKRLRARRFDHLCLMDMGRAALVQGRRAEAADYLRQALAMARETSLSFFGPAIMASLAEAVFEPSKARELLAEGERVLRAGAVAHNHLMFYPVAGKLAAQMGDPDLADHYARALEEAARHEPLPWADCFVRTTRALAARARGASVTEMRDELEALHREARALGLVVAARSIEAELGG